MKKVKYFIWIIVFLILIVIFFRCASYYHLYKSYLSNKDFYGFKSFSDYVRSYYHTRKMVMEATLRQKSCLIVVDNYNRRYYIPDIKINEFISINSFGMRDKEISLKKSMDVYRILVLSDSRAISGSNPNSTFPAILERKLNAEFPERKFEVINGGVSGATTLNLFMNFALSWRKLNPDMVILDVGLVEAALNVRPFYIYHYLINRILGRLSNEPFKEGLDAFETELETLVLLGKNMDCKVVLLSLQTPMERSSPEHKKKEHGSFPSYSYSVAQERVFRIIEEHNKIIENVARRNKCIFIDMSNAVPKDNKYFLDFTHHSDEGNKIFVDVLMRELLPLVKNK